MSKDDTKIPNSKGGEVFEGKVYFDPKETRARSPSLPNIKLDYEEFHDASSEDPSERSRSDSQSSLGSTSVESFSTDSRSSSPGMEKTELLSDEELKKLGIDPHYAKYDILESQASVLNTGDEIIVMTPKQVAESVKESNLSKIRKAQLEENTRALEVLLGPKHKEFQAIESLLKEAEERKKAKAESTPSVKKLREQYEGKKSSPQEKPLNPTKGISGIYAGKDLDEIQETIRKAVDPHTYQQRELGKISKGLYKQPDADKLQR